MAKIFPNENVKSFADKVRKTKYGQKFGADVDDTSLVVRTLRDHPIYQYRFTEQKVKGGFFSDGIKNLLLGMGADSLVGNASGYLRASGLGLAKEVLSEDEFNASELSRTQNYEDYARLAKIQNTVADKLLDWGQSLDEVAKETLPEFLGADTEFGKTTFGKIYNGIARGLGQFAGMAGMYAVGSKAGKLGKLAPKTADKIGTAAVYQNAFAMRLNESISDYEMTSNKDLLDMTFDEKKKGMKGFLTYAGLSAALEVTAFKYIGNMLGNQVKSLEQMRKGGKVREGLLKDTLKKAAASANAKGLAEGSQEALGDGMMLDLTAKFLYDDERNLISREALSQRGMEFVIGYGVGALGGTTADFMSGRITGEAKSEALQRYEAEIERKLGDIDPGDRGLFTVEYVDLDTQEPKVTEVSAFDQEDALTRFKMAWKGHYDESKITRVTNASEPESGDDLVLKAREIKSPARRQFSALSSWKENPQRSDAQTKAAIAEMERPENADAVNLSQDLARLYADARGNVTLYRAAPRNRNNVKDLNAGWSLNPYTTRNFVDGPIEIFEDARENLRNEIADPELTEEELDQYVEDRTDVSELKPEMLVAEVPVENILYLDNDHVYQQAKQEKGSDDFVYSEDEVLLKDTSKIRVLENFDLDMEFYADNMITPGGIQLTDPRDSRSEAELAIMEEYRKAPRQQYFDDERLADPTLTDKYDDRAVLYARGFKPTKNTPAKNLVKKYIDDRTPIAVGSTFSGGGTLELALAQAGISYNKVFSVEYNPTIIAEHNRIHGTDFAAQSIADVNWKEMLEKHPELANSYMHHSPVCKRYSAMTRAKRIQQEKDFAEGKTEDPYYLDKISAKKIVESINVIAPPLITIENVADYKNSPEMTKIRRALKKQGYFITEDVIDTAYLGAVQARKRLIVRASKLSPPISVADLGYSEDPANITGDWSVTLDKQIKRELKENTLPKDYFLDGKTSYLRNLKERFEKPGAGGKEYPRDRAYLHIGTNGMSGLSQEGFPIKTIMAAQIAKGPQEGEFKGQRAFIFVPDVDPKTGKNKEMSVLVEGERTSKKPAGATRYEYDRFELVNGRAIEITADMYPRLMGLNINAKYPTDLKLARGLMGNGMQAELTTKIIAPFIESQGYYGSVSKTVEDIQLEERKADHDQEFFVWWQSQIAKTGQLLKPDLSNLDFAAEQSVIDVYNWLQDNPTFAEYYDTDLQVAKQIIEEEFGTLSDTEYDLFKTFMGLTSPNTALPTNTLEAYKLFKVYKARGAQGFVDYLERNIDPETREEGATNLMGGKRNPILSVFYLAEQQGGIQQALDFLKGTDTIQNLNALKRSLPYFSTESAKVGDPNYVREIVRQGTGQDVQIPRMFMFGPKVGAYTLNLNGESQFTTTDIWESRMIRSYFDGLFKEGEVGLPANIDQALFFQKFAGRFNEKFNQVLKKRGMKPLDPSALQAVRWFYILEKTNQAGYKDAKTNETISGYIRRAATKLEGFNPRSGRRSSSRDASRSTESERQESQDEVLKASYRFPKFTTAEQKIAFQNTEKYIRKNFEEIINSPELDGLKLVTSYDKSNPTAMYNPSTHEIVINPQKINRQFGGMENKRGYTSLMREELIHAVSVVALGKRVNGARVAVGKKPLTLTENSLDFYSDLGAKLSKSEVQELELAYNDGKKMSDYNLGAEYFRVVLQKASYGAITEQTDKFYGSSHRFVTNLLKGAQKYIATELKDSVLIDNETTLIFRDTARLLAKLDPKAKPYNGTLVQQALDIVSPVTGQKEVTLDNFLGSRTEPKTPGKPPSIVGKDKGLKWWEKYTVPVGQVLRDLHPKLELVFTDFIMDRDLKILKAHKASKNFSEKYNNIKDKADRRSLKQTLMFSPFSNSEMSRQDQQAIIADRDALLRKYDLFNEFKVVQGLLASIRQEGVDIGMEIGDLVEYFPRVLSKDGRNKLLEEYGDPQSATTFREYIDLINEERKNNKREVHQVFVYNPSTGESVPGATFATVDAARRKAEGIDNARVESIFLPDPQPPIMPGSPEEGLEIEKYLNQYGKFDKGTKPRFTGTRKIELIKDDMLDYYDDPGDALSKYFQGMYNHIETVKFSGQGAPKISQPELGQIEYEFDPRSILGKTIQEIMNDPSIDRHQQEKIMSTFPELYKKMMVKNASPEMWQFNALRQFSYFSLMIEPTSTLSQLYDLAFTMYNNFFESPAALAAGFTGTTQFKIEDFIDTRRIQEEFRTDTDHMANVIRTGLKWTGFTKLDTIMKETTMDANYRRYSKVAKDLNYDGTIKKGLTKRRQAEAELLLSELNTYIGPRVGKEGEVVEMIQALKVPHEKRSPREKSLIGSTLVRKLFENQPITELRMPVEVMNNPNLRGVYTLKSFMIVQLNTFNQETYQKILNPATRVEGFKNLAKLLTFFALIGIPTDVIKDLISGRTGYMSDHVFNSIIRVGGINKYHLYQMRREGIGRALLDFTLPVPLMRVIDVTQQMGEVTLGTFYEMEEKSFADAFGYKLHSSRVLQNIPGFGLLAYRFPEAREKERQKMKRREEQARKGDPFRYGLETASPKPIGITLAAFESIAPFGR